MNAANGWHVVVVDDSVDDRADVRRMLLAGSERRYRFDEAATGAAGIALVCAADPPPTCVVLDFNLPDMNAPEVLAALRGDGDMAWCAVVVITGSARAASGHDLLQLGAQDFLGKAWMSPQSLTRSVENAVERHRMARALHESEARLRLALEASATGIWCWDIDSGAVQWSRECYAIMGIAEEAFTHDAAGFDALLHPGDRARVWASVNAAVAAHGTYEEEFRILVPTGTRWLRNVGRAQYAADGRPLRVIGTVTDVSARKHAEQALQASQSLLASVFEQLPLGIGVTDAGGRWLMANESMQAVVPHALASTLPDRIPRWRFPDGDGGELPPTRWPGARALRGETVRNAEALFRDDAGSERWMSINAAPLRGETQRVTGAIVVVQDVDERRRAEAALIDADRRKDEFLATLAHELRNPLAPISNALHLLGTPKGMERDPRVQEILERQVGYMVRLVDDLMETSRISRGVIDLQRTRLDLADVLRDAVETSQPLIARGLHRFDVQVCDEPLPVVGDAMRLTQVFANLLNNAAKYTERGGRIELAACRDGHDALVTVRDSGIGIDAGDLPHLFEMFAQFDRARGQGGLGIGLSLVQRLAQMHGGTATAASPGLGQGSTFSVRLPLAAPGAAGRRTNGPAPPQARAHCVLVVDDNHDAADSLRMVLEVEGAEVRVAYDGASALATLEEWRPTAMLLDLGMPGMDGFELARRIRADARHRHATLIALTGWGQAEDRHRTRAAGFDHHLVKPVDLAALRPLLHRPATRHALL